MLGKKRLLSLLLAGVLLPFASSAPVSSGVALPKAVGSSRSSLELLGRSPDVAVIGADLDNNPQIIVTTAQQNNALDRRDVPEPVEHLVPVERRHLL